MFDLLLRENLTGAGVPVPVHGRGIVFLGVDGLWRVRLPDGSVSVMGVNRAKVGGDLSNEAETQPIAQMDAVLGGGCSAVLSAFGTVSSVAGADFVVSVVRSGQVEIAVPVACPAGAVGLPWAVCVRLFSVDGKVFLEVGNTLYADESKEVAMVDLADGLGVVCAVNVHCVGGAVAVAGGFVDRGLFLAVGA